jgi:flagellar hook-associated protein 3 FlgL
MEQFLQAKSAGGDFKLVQKTASDALATINDKLNASFNGQYLFAGVNTDVRPMATDPTDPSSPGRNAMNAAFLAHFGMNQSDPAVAAISASDVSNYINGPFAALFEDSSWRANFSGASEKVIRSRVSMSEVVDSSVSADAGPFRDVTRALSIISASAIDRMGSQAAGAALDLALKALGEGQQGVTAMQSSLGAVQKRVEDATERLTIQSQSLAKTLGSIEDIDPYEVSVRLNTLSTQLDTAYALTSRMQNLSLLKYL